MVSDDHTVSLWVRYKQFRTLEDRDQLVAAYTHLVNRLKPRHEAARTAWFDEDDFAQAGALGLCEAIERYNPDSGVPFEKYAAKRIAGAMNDSWRKDLDWASRRTRENLTKIEKVREAFITKHQREPNAIEVATELGIGDQIVAELMNLATSFEKGVLPISQEVSDAIIDEVSEKDWWRQAVRDLPEPEKSVVTLHYFEALTIEDVAVALGIGSVTVHKTKKRAMEALRQTSVEHAA